MPRAEFETATPARKRPQTYALDRAATGIGIYIYIYVCVCVCVCVRARARWRAVFWKRAMTGT
jgi:hypothetical protein